MCMFKIKCWSKFEFCQWNLRQLTVPCQERVELSAREWRDKLFYSSFYSLMDHNSFPNTFSFPVSDYQHIHDIEWYHTSGTVPAGSRRCHRERWCTKQDQKYIQIQSRVSFSRANVSGVTSRQGNFDAHNHWINQTWTKLLQQQLLVNIYDENKWKNESQRIIRCIYQLVLNSYLYSATQLKTKISEKYIGIWVVANCWCKRSVYGSKKLHVGPTILVWRIYTGTCW